MPEHVYGRIPVEQLRTSELTRTPVGTRPLSLREVGAGHPARVDRRHGELSAAAPSSIASSSLPPIAPTAADADAERPGGLHGGVPDRPGRRSSTAARSRGRSLVPELALRVHGDESVRRASRRTAPHPIFGDLPRAPRAVDGGRPRRRCCRTCSATTGASAHGPFPMTRPVRRQHARSSRRTTRPRRRRCSTRRAGASGANGMRTKNGRPLRFAHRRPDVEPSAQTLCGAAPGAVPKGRRAGRHRRARSPTLDRSHGRSPATSTRSCGGFSTDPSPSGIEAELGDGRHRGRRAELPALLEPEGRRAARQRGVVVRSGKSEAYASRAFQTIIDDAPAIWLYDMSCDLRA